ncbi:MAG: TIGR04282 family arsenosugar biosynthesis glycosyltransferase [Gemmatimonadota bacterium]|nr:MAG: TIGR04282 family arsenosugar biosynthesis glycosyltransferase [Gemmatimonadota bacterium]
MKRDELIIVFTKPAEPGKVMTGLHPILTPEEAAEFHLAALADTLAAAKRTLRGPVELYVAGDQDDVAELRALHPAHKVRQQCEGDLGDRLIHAFAESFARGVQRTLILGSDHPTLPPSYIADALQQLEEADVVIGPARDGGHYAVAIRRTSWPEARIIFRRIPWSTEGVLRTSLERADLVDLDVVLMPDWYDVDSPDDLQVLRGDARADSSCARFLHEVDRRRS